MEQHSVPTTSLWRSLLDEMSLLSLKKEKKNSCTSVCSWKMPLTRALFSFFSLDVSRCSDSSDEKTESQLEHSSTSAERSEDREGDMMTFLLEE